MQKRSIFNYSLELNHARDQGGGRREVQEDVIVSPKQNNISRHSEHLFTTSNFTPAGVGTFDISRPLGEHAEDNVHFLVYGGKKETERSLTEAGVGREIDKEPSLLESSPLRESKNPSITRGSDQNDRLQSKCIAHRCIMEKTSAGTNRRGEVYNAERDPGGAPTAIAIASRRCESRGSEIAERSPRTR